VKQIIKQHVYYKDTVKSVIFSLLCEPGTVGQSALVVALGLAKRVGFNTQKNSML